MLLINYWEIRHSQMGARLDQLVKQGVKQVMAFVPWQVAEADIAHIQVFTSFLQAAAERKLSVFLILTPEVGVHLPNSGLPKDIILRKENEAQHTDLGTVVVSLPPNAFNLPSLFATEFMKRYYGFMGRLDQLFADLHKNQPHLLKGVTAVITGSFWKYYRSPLGCSQSPFGGMAGDFSPQVVQSYRHCVDHFFSQREFMKPTPAAANQWKTRSLEELNRRWFYQHSEDVFRHRTSQTLKKKSHTLRVKELELYTPEADPATSYSNFLKLIAGGEIDFKRLSDLIDESSARMSYGGSSATLPFVHWTAMGGFKRLIEPEKQFLILKSILLFGGRSGGIVMDDSEWFSMSASFRSRTDALARSLVEGEFQLSSQVLYLSSHLWSYHGTLWDELVRLGFPKVRMVSSKDLVLKDRSAQLLVVDPSFVFTQELVQKLIAWAKAGRVLVLPKSQFYSNSAQDELDHALAKTKRIEVDMGVPYQLYSLGDGKVIVYDVPPGCSVLKGEPLLSWQNFVNSLLSIAEVESYCRLSDGRLSVIPLEGRRSTAAGTTGMERLAVFILNPTRRKISADLVFSTPVQINDLGNTWKQQSDSMQGEPSPSVPPANRFALEVPPFGVLSLFVDGIDFMTQRESQMAAYISEETRTSATDAATSELPGFNAMEGGFDELWN